MSFNIYSPSPLSHLLALIFLHVCVGGREAAVYAKAPDTVLLHVYVFNSQAEIVRDELLSLFQR